MCVQIIFIKIVARERLTEVGEEEESLISYMHMLNAYGFVESVSDTKYHLLGNFTVRKTFTQ